jgi:large conductance mechanosensitive channel
MAKIVQEFREFIARGNVMDLAVGVIMGAAFGKIVSSLVNDVIMPPMGLLLGKVNFKDLGFVLAHKPDGTAYTPADAVAAKVPVIAYGSFINAVIEFLIMAACVFVMVKGVNLLKRKEAASPVVTTKTEELLTEIRDALKNK